MKKGLFSLVVASCLLSAFAFGASAFAYDASTVIGQLDGSGDPDFDTSLSVNSGLDGTTSLFLPVDGEIDFVNHRLFVADSENNRVLVFNLDVNNELIDREADFVLGQSNFTDSTARLTDSGLRMPFGIGDVAYDSTSNYLYVADPGNTRVMVFDVATITNGEAAAYVLGQSDFQTAAAGASQSGFTSVYHVEVDSTNQRLFVSDYWGARVLVFDVSSLSNGQLAENVLGQATFGATGIATTSTGMRRPAGMDFDSTNNRLYLTDSSNHRVLIYDTATITDGEAAINVLGQTLFTTSSLATTNAKFQYPNDVELDETNSRVFVADSQNYRVMIFDVSAITNGEAAVNVLGKQDFTSATDVNPSVNNIGNVRGVVYDNDNNLLYAADGRGRIAIFDTAAIGDGEDMIDVLGQDDGLGTPLFDRHNINNGDLAEGFSYNNGIALDELNHRLFVADQYNSRVLVFNLDVNNEPVDYAADFVLGQADLDTFEQADFTNPDETQLSQPAGLAYDSSKNLLYVSDRAYNRVLIFDVVTIVNGEAAVNVLGQLDFNTITEDLSDVGLYYPQGLSLDVDGQRLFVADEYNTRVMIFDVATVTDGEAAANVLGQVDMFSAVADTTADTMNYPLDLVYDSTGDRLFVADSYNNRVTVFDTAVVTDGESAVNVLGQVDLVSGNSGTTNSTMYFPAGLGFDSERNRLYVSDGNARLLIFDASDVDDGDAAFAVLGQPDFDSGDLNLVGAATLNLADYLNFDGGLYYENVKNVAVATESGRIFVSESFGHRISVFDFVTLTTTSLIDGTVNDEYTANFSTAGDQGTVEYELVSGTLPAGITLNTASGLTGTPTEDGTFNLEFRAIDDLGTAGQFASEIVALSLTIAPEPPTPPSSGGGGGGGTVIPNKPSAPNTGGGTGSSTETFPPYYVAIKYLVQAGIVNGYPDGFVHPDREINRAELMKIITVGSGVSPSEEIFGNCFPDVETEWFARFVCFAKAQNFITGYQDGTFRPGREVSGVEALKIIINGLGMHSFVNTDSEIWYLPYYTTASNLGLINKDETVASLQEFSIRGEVFEKLFRMIVAVRKGGYSESLRDEFLKEAIINNNLDLTRDFEIIKK